MIIASISGSPQHSSRSSWLLQHAIKRLAPQVQHHAIAVRELPARALINADATDPAIVRAQRRLSEADAVLIGTPIYKAAYSGLLKTFLDLLPPQALRGKSVLPLGTGGSLGHLLALDYALKPVLSALGARHIVDAVYAIDAQLARRDDGGFTPDDDLLARLDASLAALIEPHPAVHRHTPREAEPPLLVARALC